MIEIKHLFGIGYVNPKEVTLIDIAKEKGEMHLMVIILKGGSNHYYFSTYDEAEKIMHKIIQKA